MFVLSCCETSRVFSRNFPACMTMMNARGIIISLLLSLITFQRFATGEKKFTDLDLRVIGRLTRPLGAQCLVFVEDSEDVSLIRAVKISSGSDVYRAVMNSTTLENILSRNTSQLKFFQKRTVIITKEELNLTNLLTKVSAPLYLTWLIFEHYVSLEEFYIPVSSKVIFIDYTPGMVYAKLVYHLKQGENETVKTVWKWNLDSGIDMFVELQKFNFDNVSMDMLALNQRESCRNLTGALLLKKMECVQQDILQLLAERLNFSINLIECMEKEHPYTYPNGTESVLFLKLKNREVDFSAVGHVIRPRRKRFYMDYVWPTYVLRSMMYLKQGRLAGRWTSYLRPLESSVWWGILIWIILTGVLIHLFEKLLLNGLKFNFLLVLDLIMSTLKALQVFCNQALSEIPPSYSIRIIYFLKFFVVLIFFQAYCGYLVSSLTVVVSRFPFKDLKGFFENGQYQIMTLRKGFHQFYFRKVIGEGQREDFMLPVEKLPGNIQEAVDKLCQETRLAFTEFREDFLNFGTLRCKISELPSPIVRLHVGIAMPTGAPVKEFFRRELLFFKSTGLVQRLGTRLSSHTDFRDEKPRDEFANVSFTQIFSIFILLGLGILLSIVILIIEIALEKRKRLSLNSLDANGRLKKIRRKL